jgi:tetratricopeptide (TPR) repeat protein
MGLSTRSQRVFRVLLNRPMKLLLASLLISGALQAAPTDQTTKESASTWVGHRIVMLRGYGEVHHAEIDRARTAVGINIVAPVLRVEGNRVWVSSTGEDDSGWLDVRDALLLSDAIPYFNTVIERNPNDWDAYLRRAEAKCAAKPALNQREAATLDYTNAIALNPTEAFLYLRRGRHSNARRLCDSALRDFETAIPLVSTPIPQDYNLTAELHSLRSSVYAGCPDTAYRDAQRAIATAQRAVDLDPTRPTLLSILAAAHASAGDFASAVAAQKQALASARSPLGIVRRANGNLSNTSAHWPRNNRSR